MPGARCARSRVWCVESTRVSHHGHTGNTRHSPRNGFTAYIALSRVTGLSCHPRRRSCLHQLDASVGASGPHDFAVRVSVARLASLPRPPHSVPNVRDDRETPLWRVRNGAQIAIDASGWETKYFFPRDWTTQIRLNRFSKFEFTRSGFQASRAGERSAHRDKSFN